MPARKNQINLLPKDSLEDTTFGRVLMWLTSSFRIMVIVTELIVLGAFLSRFWLDARNSDLNDSMKQKRAQILASANFENEFRKVQKKLSVYSDIDREQGHVSSSINDIQVSLVPEIYLLGITYADKVARIEGVALSEVSIAQFIVNIKDKESIDDVVLTEISSDNSTGPLIEFVLSANLDKMNQ